MSHGTNQDTKALRKAERSEPGAAQSRRLNSDYGAISQHVRLTPSKQEQLNKNRYKGQIFQDDAPFLLAI